jgi:porphyrinogen peroxidase
MREVMLPQQVFPVIVPVGCSRNTVNVLLGRLLRIHHKLAQVGRSLVVELNQDHRALHPVIEGAVRLGNADPGEQTMGGVNLVAGFRPELWSKTARGHAPAGIRGFNKDVKGVDGFVMPATQHDAVLWISGAAYDVVFDVAHQAIAELKSLASVAEETSSWPYQHDRDLTGFKQEQVIGRMKPDSVEIENKAPDSHVASTDQDKFGKIFRRNMPYGTVTNHGTMFVGFSADQQRLSRMLESMAGLTTSVREALTRYPRPLTGAYYFVPSTECLRQPASSND